MALDGDHIFLRDEILQLLFWMEGEKIAAHQSAESIARLLSTDPVSLGEHLELMVVDGFLLRVNDGYALTEYGKREGGRRFREEFDPLLSQGHGECNDPDCDCHDSGPEYCKHADRVN